MTMEIKVKLRITVKIVIMLLLLIVFVIMYIMFGKTQNTFYSTGSIVILSVVYAFLLYKIKLFQLIFDKTYICRVIKCEPKTIYVPIGYIRPIIRAKPVIYLTVKNEKGKRIKKCFDARNLNPKYYIPGTELIHYKGASYYVKVSPEMNEYFCPFCSKSTSVSNFRHCSFCNIDL